MTTRKCTGKSTYKGQNMFAWNGAMRYKDIILLTLMKHTESTSFLRVSTRIEQIESTAFYNEDILSLPSNVRDGT